MIKIIHSKFLKKGVVMISWPCQLSWKHLILMQCNMAGVLDMDIQSNNSIENSIIIYALYELCQMKISGNPNEARKSKFTNSNLAYKDGQCIFTFETDNTLSAIKKIIKLVGKTLDPSKTRPLAKRYAQLLNIKLTNEQWEASIKNIQLDKAKWVVFGKIAMNPDKEQKLNDLYKTNFTPVKTDPISSKNNDIIEGEIKCKNALSTLLLSKYLGTQKITSIITPNGLKPIGKLPKNISQPHKIAKFVEQKIMKINTPTEKRVVDALKTLGILEGYFSVDALVDIDKYDKHVSLVGLIKDALK